MSIGTIPVQFWTQISGSINMVAVVIVFWLVSKIYRNIMGAHKKNIYNSVNYEDCAIYKEKIK